MTAHTIIVCISDQHVGGTTALCPEKFTVHTGRKDETQQASYNKIQEWLYTAWVDFWRYAATLAGIAGRERHKRLIVFNLGDVIDGKHHNSPQVMDELKDQVEAACNLLRPVVNLADRVYLTYGTGAHNSGCGAAEIEIGNELGIRHDWEFALEVDGTTHDLAHHGRAGRRDWTTAAASIAAEVALDYVSRNLKPPRYIWRGHAHQLDDSGFKLPYTRAIVLPSWQLRTEFGHRVAANRRRSDIGGVILDTEDPDNPIFSRARYTAPAQKIERA